jgi:hypothetical protein
MLHHYGLGPDDVVKEIMHILCPLVRYYGGGRSYDNNRELLMTTLDLDEEVHHITGACDGYFSGVSLTPARAHVGTSGAPNPCDDLPAREAGLARRRRQSLPSDRHPARLPGHMG